MNITILTRTPGFLHARNEQMAENENVIQFGTSPSKVLGNDC